MTPSDTDSEPNAQLEEALGHSFAEPVLLAQALTHTSTSGGSRKNSYERLEFLGDRVLGLVVAEILFKTFPKEDEGALAKRHTALVRRDTLARVARDLDLGSLIVMTASESSSGGRDNPGILSDVCEAVIAALYLDGGMDVASAFIERHWTALVAEDLTPPKDAKTTVQEWAQGRALPLPTYEETGRTGPAHAPEFTVRLTVEGVKPVEATGTSKRNAEQAAAEQLMTILENTK